MSCLDEETILAFCRGTLAVEKRPHVLEHIASCDECRALVSAVARATMGTPDPAMAPTTPLGDGSAPRGPARAPVEAGDVLAGKYEVERVLGAGGMGVVVAARHTQLERRVALKFLLPAACEVPGAVTRFLREGKAAAKITSEHVARVTDVGVLDGGAPYLVMEYLDGEDLGAVAKARGRVPAAEAALWVLQACEAIAEAHELGIVHRDLKPANLFLTKRADGTPLVKVLDFGISKIEGGSQKQLTSAATLMGSPRYMSPEQMLSAKDVDARTDVWALGVILFELVTGRPVWEADTVQGLCALIASAPAPRVRSIVPNAPAELDDLVARCLEKDRERRVASVADLALGLEPIAPDAARTSIERIVGVAARSARRPLSSRVAPREPRRGKLPIVLGGAVAALLVAGIALNAALARREPAPMATVAITTATATATATTTATTTTTATATATASVIASATPTPPPRAAGTPTAWPARTSVTPSATVAAPPPSSSAVDPGRALTERK